MNVNKVGTSGWSYKHWEGVFYPDDVKNENKLRFYSKHFNTVEINNTFYNLPDEQTINNWISQVDSDFIFSVKANRYITHMKKLNNCEEEVKNMMKVFKHFGSNLGPILFQLPPNQHEDLRELKTFLKLLPKNE